jgi:glycosyltransferase involved in cell wall biosynthesis
VTSSRVVIAHEWLTILGGSDKTVKAMLEVIPDARVLVAVADPEFIREFLPGRQVETLWVNGLPGARTRYQSYAPAIMAAWSMKQVKDADLLVSSSHFASKAAGWGFSGRHLCYCYTPMRIAWRPDLELGRLEGPARRVARSVLPLVRGWDRATARTVDAFAGISTAVTRRIGQAYGREAARIYPPVDIDSFLTAPRRPGKHLLALGRFVGYKRFDLAIEVCSAHDLPLVVAGAGPEEERLRAMAGPSVRFAGRVDDATYAELLSEAAALLFPGEEDFGIVPVEAQAAGCPVIAFGAGGALDTVEDGRTGVLFDRQDQASLHAAIERAASIDWDEDYLREWSSRFSRARFKDAFRDFIEPPSGAPGYDGSGERSERSRRFSALPSKSGTGSAGS